MAQHMRKGGVPKSSTTTTIAQAPMMIVTTSEKIRDKATLSCQPVSNRDDTRVLDYNVCEVCLATEFVAWERV
ncbi:hypothetical protein ACJ72_06710 [Emergomyces africanus]|uniref:Uncharacterized protein n=1 Tax=Emergomyces africanus TaxID=1955775 RepID=A0A1B7NQN1_9EURO|nr:hypothetical protein ACJ72_06710 [Emergomyces africanus]